MHARPECRPQCGEIGALTLSTGDQHPGSIVKYPGDRGSRCTHVSAFGIIEPTHTRMLGDEMAPVFEPNKRSQDRILYLS